MPVTSAPTSNRAARLWNAGARLTANSFQKGERSSASAGNTRPKLITPAGWAAPASMRGSSGIQCVA